jgi:hypothetical protein
MKKRTVGLFAVPVLVCMAGIFFPVAAQSNPETFAMPRMPDGKPNFTGVYASPAFTHPDPPGEFNIPSAALAALDADTLPALTTLGEKLFLRKHTGITRIDNPFGVCLPGGIFGYVLGPYAQEWLQAPNFIVIRYEYINNEHRVVWMDRRSHSKDLEPSHFGESIGWWEGDTLVIDTIGFKEGPLDEWGHISAGQTPEPGKPMPGVRYNSDKLHVVERLTWTGPRRVQYDIIVEDSEYLADPWKTERKMTLHPTWKLQEMICEENNRCEDGKCSTSEVQQ